MCRPDGRHVLNNQGTDDYVLTFPAIYGDISQSLFSCNRDLSVN